MLEAAQLAKECDPVQLRSLRLSEFDQILVDVSDALTAGFRLPAAVIAGHAAHAQMTAGAAFAERVVVFLQARSMGRIGGAVISMQCPLDRIIGAAVAMNAAAVIQNYDI